MNEISVAKCVTMTSLELVEFINSQRDDGEPELRHDSFMAKVPKVIGAANAPTFLGTQKYGNNNTRDIFIFPKREACLMAMSYSYDIQAKVFDRMTELEQAAAGRSIMMPDFTNPALAARAWADQVEARMIAEKTKAEIGSRREATAMQTASVAVKKATRLEVELDQSKQYATVKRMEMAYHGQKFNWRHLKEAATNLGIPAIDVFDQNYGTVKSYHADVWREAFALDITTVN